jgi:hypothetical protein
LGNPSWVSGKLNSALQFNGLNQYVDFGNSTGNFERTQAFSVELWFKTSATGTGQIIISKIQPTGDFRGWEIFYDGTATNNIYFDLINQVSPSNMLRVYCSPSVVANNNWHHLVVTYDGTSSPTGVKFYFDGVLKSTGTTTNTLTATILTSTTLQLDGRNSGATGLVGTIDEAVIYTGVLSSDQVTARYNGGSGTETPLGNYRAGNYTIQAINNFSFSASLNQFTETATKTGSDIRYSVTSNGSWRYWNGSSWANSDGSWAKSNSASDINSNIGTLASSGNFSFRAVLHSTNGIYTPYLDSIETSFCSENWVNYNTTCGNNCGSWDKLRTYYLDINNCGTNTSLPANNGTCFSCNYCSPTWKCDLFDTSCGDNMSNPDFIYCTNVSVTNYLSCCAITGLPSDCSNYTGNYSEFTQLCGDIRVVLEVPYYPYVDLNASYPMNIYLYQNNISKNLTDFFINLTSPDLNSSVYNFTWSDINERYENSFIFTELGNYPFNIYARYPYDKISNITGTLKVRDTFNVTFSFITSIQNSSIWNVLWSNKYINDYAYVTAEIDPNPNQYSNAVEPFFAQIPKGLTTRIQVPVWYAPYRNGIATLKLYDGGDYIIRLIDGEIIFSGEYSVPNVTKSYGTNAYIGQYALNQTSSYEVLLTTKTLHPYTWLLNLLLVLLIIGSIIVSVFMLFMIPSHPAIALSFGIVLPISLVVLRLILYFIWET